MSLLGAVEDVLGFLNGVAAVDNLLVGVVAAEAEDAHVLHALEDVDDHLVVVEEGLDAGEVVLLLLEAVSMIEHLSGLQLQQLRIVDGDVAVVAHRLVGLVRLC